MIQSYIIPVEGLTIDLLPGQYVIRAARGLTITAGDVQTITEPCTEFPFHHLVGAIEITSGGVPTAIEIQHQPITDSPKG